MANCEACEDLRSYAPNFVLNGITSKECGSLKKNTGLNPNLSVLHGNCEDLNDINDCLIGAFGDTLPSYDICTVMEFLEKSSGNQYEMNKALICSDCGQWDEIKNLYTIIESITGAEYTWLTKDVDYEVTFFNGFYTGSGTIRVGVIEALDRFIVRIAGSSSNDTQLRHNKLVDVRMRHTSSIKEEPKSMIYGVNFKGKYAALNNYRFINNTGSATGIWNVSPRSTRASWQASITPSHNYDGYKIVTSLLSYADGYNEQFTVYGNDEISSPHINHTVDFTLLKP